LSENKAGIPSQGEPFVVSDLSEWKTVGQGIQRQILAHGPDLMLVKVVFEPGSIGAMHHHPHRQATYVAEGTFEATVGGEKRTLRAGDSFFAAADVRHSVVALEKGALIDCFTPGRADFLNVPQT
jgi:quercetin dioxygenase-like cupin family protein